MRKIVLLSLLALACYGQLNPSVFHPTNIDLREGEPGATPPGWFMPTAVVTAGYRAELRREGCGGRFTTCVAYVPPIQITDVKAAELQQPFPAEAYRGKTVRFSAWLRMENPADGYVHVRMRVFFGNGDSKLYDSEAEPVNSNVWQRRDVTASVPANAVRIAIWARYVPGGKAWVAEPSFEIAGDVPHYVDERNVRELIKKFADARNAHDGTAVAELYSEDGVWMQRMGRAILRGRQDLANMWGRVKGQVERTVESVDFPGDNLAVVHVTTLYAEPTGRHYEVFVAIKENGAWHIQLHQTLE